MVHCTRTLITAGVENLELVSGAQQVTTTKQLGTSKTTCRPIVEGRAAGVKNDEVSSTAIATSVLRGLRRTVEEITGAVEYVEAGPSVEEECPAQRKANESGQAHYDENNWITAGPENGG